jgi:hypothetical protein
MDYICMQLIAIGESLNNIDKLAGTVFPLKFAQYLKCRIFIHE